MIQLAMILLAFLTGPAMHEYWTMQAKASNSLRQLSITEGFAWPSARPDGMMIPELTRMMCQILMNPYFCDQLRTRCFLCHKFCANPTTLVLHLQTRGLTMVSATMHGKPYLATRGQ